MIVRLLDLVIDDLFGDWGYGSATASPHPQWSINPQFPNQSLDSAIPSIQSPDFQSPNPSMVIYQSSFTPNCMSRGPKSVLLAELRFRKLVLSVRLTVAAFVAAS